MSDRTPKFRPVDGVVKADEATMTAVVNRVRACEEKIKTLEAIVNRLEGKDKDGNDDSGEKRGPGRPRKEQVIHA